MERTDMVGMWYITTVLSQRPVKVIEKTPRGNVRYIVNGRERITGSDPGNVEIVEHNHEQGPRYRSNCEACDILCDLNVSS